MDTLLDSRIFKYIPKEALMEGMECPRWYTYCYWDFNRDCAIYCPIGLSYIITIGMALRRFFKYELPFFLGRQESYGKKMFHLGLMRRKP